MFRYAQINTSGFVVSDSYLSGEVVAENMIAIDENFDLTNKGFVDGKWVEYTPEPPVPQLTGQEILQAELLLNQMTILDNQTAQDTTMAEILIGQTGGVVNV